MDQQKIGAFIFKCRKELNMTQQELAKKIGVTDKAISKWENGRCMMDISMLKPLSECFNCSVMELINGERIDEERLNVVTDETIENTLKYADNRIKKVVKSIIKILGVVIICLFILFGYFLYKTYCAYGLYYVDELEIDSEFLNKALICLNNSSEIDIYSKEIDESEYLILDNFKIRNDFSGFERIDNKESGTVSFVDYTNKEAVYFRIKYTYIDTFKTYSYSSDRGDNYDRRKEFLLNNNINNDLDLFNYVIDNYYMENYWFDSIKKLRNNYMVNDFALEIFRECDNSIRMKGIYEGYIYNYSYKSEDTCGISYARVVEIFNNDCVYEITFEGDKYKNDEYIKDILSTLVIIE